MMESIRAYLIPFIISNLVFGLSIAGAIKKPMWTRIFLIVLFLWASYFNSTHALQSPEIYLAYATVGALPLYVHFINGFFSQHITPFVVSVAIGQAMIALGLVLNNGWTKTACVGGIIFGLAIAPLGVGSAFPSTVSMAISFYILFRKHDHDFIWKWKQYTK